MSNDLNANAEFKGKHNDEEDPILVAQRYLNIYHQIHIFNKTRQEEFDKSLLDLPSNIKMLLSTLPGGSVLLDHITELEEKEGFIEISREEEKEKNIKSKNIKSKNDEKANKEESTQNIHTDVNISNAVLKMLKQSEEKHDKDMKALTNAFLQSQANMADILKEVLQNKNAPAVNKEEQYLSPTNEKTKPVDEYTDTTKKEDIEEEVTPEIKKEESTENNHQTEDVHEKSKLFNFTKKIFSGFIDKKEYHLEKDLPSIGDVTPVYLDDVDQNPISLDVEDSLSLEQPIEKEESAVHEEKILNDEQMPTQQENISETTDKESEELKDDSNDWEWEYVDEEEEKPEEDDDWEYVEIPQEDDDVINNEFQKEDLEQSQNDNDWEYVEVPQEEDKITDNLQEEQESKQEDSEDASTDFQNSETLQNDENMFQTQEYSEDLQSDQFLDQYVGDELAYENPQIYDDNQNYADYAADQSDNDQLMERYMNNNLDENQDVDYMQAFDDLSGDTTNEK